MAIQIFTSKTMPVQTLHFLFLGLKKINPGLFILRSGV